MITYTPFDTPSRIFRGNPIEGRIGPVNIGHRERYASMISGAAMVVLGLSKRNLPGLLFAALGGVFVMRGVGGHCKLYDAIGVSTAGSVRPGVPNHTGQKVERTIFIARPPEELFRFWRNLENLPEFMESIESVKVRDDNHSHWTVRGPAGHRIEWDAEIINEHPGEMISWQSLPGSDIQSAGTVRFTPTEDNRGTLLRVVLEFHPPGGMLGSGVARLLGRDPVLQVDRDLNRLKEIIESHDVSTGHRAEESPMI